MIKNILVWTKCNFDFTSRGLVVQYELCRILKIQYLMTIMIIILI
jgi:hypothetical protein